MGAWGIKGLESDTGLDLLGDLEHQFGNSPTQSLAACVAVGVPQGFVNRDYVDSEYDQSVLVLAELFLMYQNGQTEGIALLENRAACTADTASLETLLQALKAAKDEPPNTMLGAPMWKR